LKSEPYKSEKRAITKYEFISIGPKGRLKKRVEFTALRRRKLYNIGFGDVMPDGQVDKVNTNNSDLVKVLGTVISIIQSFRTQIFDFKETALLNHLFLIKLQTLMNCFQELS